MPRARVEKVGIPTAVDAGGKRFGRGAIDEVPHRFTPPLHCGGQACKAAVSAVMGHVRESSSVASYFRLRKGNEHSPGCGFRFEHRMGQIIEQHRDVAVEGDLYVLVLRPQDSVAQPDEPVEKPGSGPRATRLQVTHTPRPGMSTVLQAAAAIARLLHDFDHDPAAQEAFRARYGRTTIRWEQFYFHAERDIEPLAKRVDRGAKHPLAVEGVVSRVTPKHHNDGSLHYHRVELRTGTRKVRGAWVNVHLYTTVPSRLGYREGDRVLAYGKWEWIPPKKGADPTRRYLRLWCNSGSDTVRLSSANA